MKILLERRDDTRGKEDQTSSTWRGENLQGLSAGLPPIIKILENSKPPWLKSAQALRMKGYPKLDEGVMNDHRRYEHSSPSKCFRE